jgi:predicted enzyme related to lactoylglutathione lyase
VAWCEVLGCEGAGHRHGFLLLRSGGAEVVLRPDAAPTPMRVALEVHSVDEAYARCEGRLTIVEPLVTHESGRRHFVVADPDGHQLEVAEQPSHEGRIAWVDLTVDDATASRDFWAHIGGFDGIEAVSMGTYNDFSLTSDGKAVVGVCHRRGPNAGLPPVWMVYFAVASLDEALAAVHAHGGEIVERRDPMAVVRGPGGAIAALVEG